MDGNIGPKATGRTGTAPLAAALLLVLPSFGIRGQDIGEYVYRYRGQVGAVHGFTILHASARDGHEEAVRALLRGGTVDVNARHAYGPYGAVNGLTPLHVAVDHGRAGVVRVLVLDEGVDVHAKDAEGWMAVHRAAAVGNEDVLRSLLEGGSDVNARGGAQDMTPLRVASGNGDSKKAVALVLFLLDHGADIDAQDSGGWTALHVAIKRGDWALFHALLERGASVDLPNNSGLTPLHGAAKFGRKEFVRALLERGANPGAKIKDFLTPNLTPKEFAVLHGHGDIAAMLEEHQARAKRPGQDALSKAAQDACKS